MATKYPKSAQTGDEGVALLRKIATAAGGVYRAFENPDLGVDGTIELLTEASRGVIQAGSDEAERIQAELRGEAIAEAAPADRRAS